MRPLAKRFGKKLFNAQPRRPPLRFSHSEHSLPLPRQLFIVASAIHRLYKLPSTQPSAQQPLTHGRDRRPRCEYHRSSPTRG